MRYACTNHMHPSSADPWADFYCETLPFLIQLGYSLLKPHGEHRNVVNHWGGHLNTK